ncbi:MAG: protein kinase, partial [Myxococcales bacterium]|nr:protein kinase [Myxococcales bacterium]
MATSGGPTPVEEKDSPLVSDSVEPHKLLPLWEHALAEVFAHGDGKEQRALQLTFVRDGIASGDEGRRRCVDDNEALGGLQCPQIQPILEVRRVGSGRLVLASELVQGTSLGQHAFEGPMAPERVIAILRQLCRALDAAHGVGIRHGALSVASVLLTEEDARQDAVRLVDFGLHHGLTVEAMGDHEVELQPLSPEKVRGEAPDVREDIYLLGAVGYTALAGRPPFEGRPDAVREGHAKRSPDMLDVDAPLAAIIMRCLDKDPAKRFDDVRAIDDALVEAQGLSGLITDWEDLPPIAKASASLSHGRMTMAKEGTRIPSGPFSMVPGARRAKSGPIEHATSRPEPKAVSKPAPAEADRAISKPEPVAASKPTLAKATRATSKPEPRASQPTPAPAPARASQPTPTPVPKPAPARAAPKRDAVPEEVQVLDTASLMLDSESSSPPPLPPAVKKTKLSRTSESSGTGPTVSPTAAQPKGGIIPPPPTTGARDKHQDATRRDRASALGLN